MQHLSASLLAVILLTGHAVAAAPGEIFAKGEGVGLDRAIPANERGILCLALGSNGRLYGGTTGRAAHLFVYDQAKDSVRSVARLDGGVGFAHALIAMPDGSWIGGTQADPTGIAVTTDPKAIGHLYRFVVADNGPAKVNDLGAPVPGQGIYTLAYLPTSKAIVGNTWPDGHFFSYDPVAGRFKDYGAIAGYHTYEMPEHAQDLNRGTKEGIHYPRQVSRAIAVGPDGNAYTGGADGFLFRYNAATRKLEKLKQRLPAGAGREPWASLDACTTLGNTGRYSLGGTSDGYLVKIDWEAKDRGAMVPPQLLSLGKPLAQSTIQVLAPARINLFDSPSLDHRLDLGIGGNLDGMPRWFVVENQKDVFQPEVQVVAVRPGGIPHVDGQPSMVGYGAAVFDAGTGIIYAGERDRIARLVRFRLSPKAKPAEAAKPVAAQVAPSFEEAPALDCRLVFAPLGTTTDGSGYTAIEVGKDGRVYVGAARYGGYAWLLRFDPAAKPVFMDKVVNMRQLTGEHRQGINTQGKIHAKILVGADGKVWFASKQAHEIFDTRPEYGEDPDGFPGGHLCYFDPATGFSRSMGILKKQEGLMAGAIDDVRGTLYYRSEPKNHFLVYDIKTGDVRDRGQVGAFCRYMAMDKNGAVYTVGREPYLARYDPKTSYVEDLAIKVEGPGNYTPPYVLAIGPNGKLYGVAAGHPSLMEFDIDTYRPGPFAEVTMRNVAPAGPAGMPVLDIHAAIFGKDGKFYYPLNTSGPLTRGGKPEAHLRIMRFNPVSKETETVGIPRLVDFDEAKVQHVYTRKAKYALQYMQGAAVGEDGSLYLLAIYPQLSVACFPKLTAPSGK
jgi:hypothetical protein